MPGVVRVSGEKQGCWYRVPNSALWRRPPCRTCDPVSIWLSMAHVCVFQKRMWRSAVPPPVASRLDW